MYKVLRPFVDGESGAAWPPHRGGFYYAKGEGYPKGGFKPSGSHIDYLLSNENAFNAPVIEKQAPSETLKQPTFEELMRMNKDELLKLAAKKQERWTQAQQKKSLQKQYWKVR